MAGIAITVTEMNPPAQGKKQWNLIDSTGKRWGVNPEDANMFSPGQSYTVDQYKSSEFKGKTYYTISAASPIQRQANGPAPIVAPPQATLTLKDEVIFVAGQMNNAMSNPSINPFGITTVERIKFINDCRTAWRNTFGKVQSDDEMSDEIPY